MDAKLTPPSVIHMFWDPTDGLSQEQKKAEDEEGHELLQRLQGLETPSQVDTFDTAPESMTGVRMLAPSYQSTARLIVWAFLSIAALFTAFASMAVFSSIASKRKVEYNISYISPSVNLASGPCESLKYVNWALHLLINCVATVVISGSNYMQTSIIQNTV
jgi:hypothetical protein